MTGAVLGLAASLITFSSLWAATGTVPPPLPHVVASGEGDGQEEAKVKAKEAEPYDVESDTATSSYVEVKNTQA